MRFRETPLVGAFVIELERRDDERGFFARTYCDREFAAHGLPTSWPQSNLSRNAQNGTLRGMHFNAPPDEEAKVVRCVSGAIWDAIVDLRPTSPTFLRWFGAELSAEAGNALYVPAGFAHGFLTFATGPTSSTRWVRSTRPTPRAACGGTTRAGHRLAGDAGDDVRPRPHLSRPRRRGAGATAMSARMG